MCRCRQPTKPVIFVIAFLSFTLFSTISFLQKCGQHISRELYLRHDVYFRQPNVIKLARKSISVEIKHNIQTDSQNPGFLNSIIIFVFERIDDLISLKYSAVHCTVQYDLIEEEAIPLTNLTKHMTHTDCYAA